MEQSIESGELFFNPGWFNLKEETIFNVQEGATTIKVLGYEGQKIVSGITFGASLDKQTFKRSIYNALNFLGDVGGLRDALTLIGRLFLTLAGQQTLESFLVGKIMKSPSKIELRDPECHNDLEKSIAATSSRPWFKPFTN